MSAFASRRERLWHAAKAEGLDALLITNPLNVTYLTGFSGDSSYLVASPTRTMLVSDGRFTEQIAEECPGLDTHIRPPAQGIQEAAAKVLHQLGFSDVGFESGHVTVADLARLSDQAAGVSFKPGADRVEKLRQIKDEGEVDEIRAAIRIAEKAFAMFRACLRPSDTEKELGDAIEMYVRRAGGRSTAFAPIVAVGARAALPHAPLSHHRVDEAPLLLVDWGANGPFYKSDLTRVLLTHNNSATSPARWPAGELTKIQAIYQLVLRAQEAARLVLRPGAKGGDIDAAARSVIADAGYGAYFNHSIGHGFGLQIHEAPLMRPGSEVVLQAGMVVTIEPGIYVPGLAGVRIEDDFLIAPEGSERLTSLPREYDENAVEW
jgi:Xaa-Pro aminopeptidase